MVGGLAIIGPDRQHESLRMFFTSDLDVGVALLRRDGFASIGSADPARGAMVVTVPLVFETPKRCLFVNLEGGLRSLAVLSTGDDTAPPLLTSATTPLPRTTNSTMIELPMKPGSVRNIASLRGKPFRLAIALEPGARLYAVWLSEAHEGKSGGWLGSGGPGYPRGLRDA
eukprot:COSAG06_NODE_209_length_20178_cov_4.309478_19_plen_170_part_00